MTSGLLVVAGEASGDRAAAAVVAKLRGRCQAFGMGGGALQREGLELLADLRTTTALGVTEVARRAYGVGAAWRRLRAAIKKRRPSAALLVNYTEFNARLAPILWSEGARVLWYGAPQIWAWRAGRAEPLRRHLDRLALMLPFEEPLWRGLGVDAHYVGHPALEDRRGPEHRVAARELLGLTPFAWAIAILPGSRPHEVRRLLEPMLSGYEAVRGDRASVDARVMLAASLDDRTRAWAKDLARARGVDVVDVDPRAGLAYALPAFDAALCASGTASLECALARVVPVVCYRVGWAAELGARALLRTKHVALPNVLLGREAFPELLQRRAAADHIADELARVLDERDTFLAACAEVEQLLGDHPCPSREVARMLEPWLAAPAIGPHPRTAC
ncbi:MAG: lipid-A-disaccharide synthase [Labilithrix sp.]|nr:lipid-A-disaccharide synthase [Labilithrix sp.]